MLTQETVLETIEKIENDTEEPKVTHIIQRGNYESAQARILEAMVNGTPITALCGFVFVPSRDHTKYPICEKCLEVVKFAADLSK